MKSGERKRLRPQVRLKNPEDFQRVYEAQAALHGPILVLFFRPNGLDTSRFGVSVSKKHGNAVRRNHIKRVLREAFRLSIHLLPCGYDFVLIPRRGVERYQKKNVQASLERFTLKIPRLDTAGHTRTATSSPDGSGEHSVGKGRRGISRRVFIKRPDRNP